MTEKHFKKNLYFFAGLCSFLILLLGLWWLYLIWKLATPHFSQQLAFGGNLNYFRLVLWEGSFFFLFFISLIISLGIIFYRDYERIKTSNLFFTSLSHELKTPLTSIKMQTDLLLELFADKYPEIKKYLLRICEDEERLENELNKFLEIAELNFSKSATSPAQQVDIIESINKCLKSFDNFDVCFQLQNMPARALTMGYPFAFTIILRNIVLNSLKHNQNRDLPPQIYFIYDQDKKYHHLKISDQATNNQSNEKYIQQLFKNPPFFQGHGLGLYIIRSLMHSMHGKISILVKPQFTIILKFKKAKSE